MKKIVLSVAGFLLALQLNAQAPQGINYQAVVRNTSGSTINNTAVGMKVSIRQNTATGTIVYSETFTPVTSGLGLVNFVIGQGNVVTGTFSTINWSTGNYFCEVAVDVAGGTNYLSMGAQQFMSVPYALYAATSGSGGSSYTAGPGIGISGTTISAADPSATNEFQNLTLSGSTLSISNGNTVTLPVGTTYSAGTGIGITGTTISATDDSATNEFQNLTLSGSTLSISNGNTVTLPVGTTYTAGTGIGISGTTISATDASVTNEIQSLTVSGSILSISGGNTVTLPTGGGTLDQSYDFGGAGAGRTITADSGPVTINGSGTNTAALGVAFSGTGNAINAANTNPATTFSTIQATTTSSTTANAAVLGQSSGAARGVTGEVTAAGTGDAAVRGNNLRTSGGMGVEGVGFNGVSGQTNQRQGYGVFGQNFNLTGPTTEDATGVGGLGLYGVVGQSVNAATGAGIASADNIIAFGTLFVYGTKNFRIDHPLDPENKYLNHFSIESDEVLNIYRGTVAFDASGNAEVQLPVWFDAVNKNASYQLTPIGGYAPIYIAQKIVDGKFIISGGQAGMEVSWAVYAERNDPYLQQHPEAREVEPAKPEENKGQYLRPDVYNQPAEKGILKPLKPIR